MLNEKIRVGNLVLNNRLVMPPMATEKSDGGLISHDLVDHYEKRAGEIGLIIVEHSYVSKDGRVSKNQLAMDGTNGIGDLKRITKAIHKRDNTKVFIQLNHGGKDMGVDDYLSISEMKRIRDDFKRASGLAREASFDGIEIHGCHGYLLNKFYSPLTNKRTDIYGGDLYGRLGYIFEIIDDIRKEVGRDYPIAIRFGPRDFMENGASLEDEIGASLEFEKRGIDLLDISGGLNGPGIKGRYDEGYFLDISKAIKEVVSIPIILTGGIRTRKKCEEILENGGADLIGIGRPILKDPSYISKILNV